MRSTCVRASRPAASRSPTSRGRAPAHRQRRRRGDCQVARRPPAQVAAIAVEGASPAARLLVFVRMNSSRERPRSGFRLLGAASRVAAGSAPIASFRQSPGRLRLGSVPPTRLASKGRQCRASFRPDKPLPGLRVNSRANTPRRNDPKGELARRPMKAALAGSLQPARDTTKRLGLPENRGVPGSSPGLAIDRKQRRSRDFVA
jgi:hypothetical protein